MRWPMGASLKQSSSKIFLLLFLLLYQTSIILFIRFLCVQFIKYSRKAAGNIELLFIHVTCGHKQCVCDKCSKGSAVQSDYEAHLKNCGTRGHSCDCGRVFSRFFIDMMICKLEGLVLLISVQ